MISPDLTTYQHEYQTLGVGTLIYDLILTIVRQGTWRYPPAIYSPNRIWDEDAFLALAHDFTMNTLLGRGWLDYHLLSQDDVTGLLKALQRDFRHFLISQKRRSETTNLFERVREILTSDPRFVSCTEHEKDTQTTWGLQGWTHFKQIERIEDVTRAMFSVALPPIIRYRADSTKISHLISTTDLSQLLVATMQTLGKCSSVNQLMDGLRYRLSLFESTPISLDAPLWDGMEDAPRFYKDILISANDSYLKIEIQQVVDDIYHRLSDRQRAVLALHLSNSGSTLEQIGQRLHVSKSTIHNDLQAIIQQIRDVDIQEEDAETAITYLSEISLTYFQQFAEWEGDPK